MREFIITKLCCATCGSILTLADSQNAAGRNVPHCAGEPTGATRVQQVIAVEPCETCARPAVDVAEALATLMRHASAQKRGG